MMYIKEIVSNNVCPICGGDHSVLVIYFETGNIVIPRPFFYERIASAAPSKGSIMEE
jgi:hypothetical protein